MARSRSYLHTLGPNAGIINLLEAPSRIGVDSERVEKNCGRL